MPGLLLANSQVHRAYGGKDRNERCLGPGCLAAPLQLRLCYFRCFNSSSRLSQWSRSFFPAMLGSTTPMGPRHNPMSNHAGRFPRSCLSATKKDTIPHTRANRTSSGNSRSSIYRLRVSDDDIHWRINGDCCSISLSSSRKYVSGYSVNPSHMSASESHVSSPSSHPGGCGT